MAKTIRVGFPNAEIVIYDAGSHLDCSRKMVDIAKKNDLLYAPVGSRIEFVSFLSLLLLTKPIEGPIVIVHSDVAFWDRCDDWSFTRLIAGKFIPRWRNEMVGCIQEPQLDPAFLWITDAARFRLQSLAVTAQRFLFDPFARFTTHDLKTGDWRFWDCTSSLCAAWPDDIEKFSEYHQNFYDHLYSGTYLNWAASRSRNGAELTARHLAVATDINALRNSWKSVDEWFASRAIGTDA